MKLLLLSTWSSFLGISRRAGFSLPTHHRRGRLKPALRRNMEEDCGRVLRARFGPRPYSPTRARNRFTSSSVRYIPVRRSSSITGRAAGITLFRRASRMIPTVSRSVRESKARHAATSLKFIKHDFNVGISHGNRQDGRLTVTEIPRRDVRGNPGCGNNLEPGRFLDPLNRRVGRAVREDLVDHLIGDEQLIGFDL